MQITQAGLETGLPYIGIIDPKNPLDLAFIAAILLSATMLKGTARVAVPVGILAIRWQLSKISL